MNRHFAKILFLLFALLSCGKEETPPADKTAEPAGQQTENVATPAKAPRLRLESRTFAELPGWEQDNQSEAYEAFLLSCEKLAHTKKDFIGKGEIKIPTETYRQICREAALTPAAQFRRFAEEHFTPYLVLYDGSAEGKFTAYYEPVIRVAHEKSDVYKYPIHARPLDLIEFNPRDFDKNMPSKRLVGRIKGQKLVPYYSREEILSGKGNAPVLLWSDSFVDVFVMHIQGPAVAELPDGSRIRISYADTNGREFQGIGSILLRHGELKPGGASMDKVKKWLLENPDKAKAYMNENPRYVFHRLIGASGPMGALGVPLAAGRSLAVDPGFIPLGALLWLDTTAPNGKPIRRLVNAQDVGSAIKGAVRGDYYWGSGGDDILETAGKMHAKGRYYILLPKQGDEQK